MGVLLRGANLGDQSKGSENLLQIYLIFMGLEWKNCPIHITKSVEIYSILI